MRRLIVDGNNVLHASAELSRLLERDLGTARARLTDRVASYSGGSWSTSLVFDGGSLTGDESVEDVGGIQVVSTPSGTPADTVVERLAREAREHGEKAVVVTSDATTQWTVMGAGVTRMSARAFLAELEADAAERERGGASGRPKVALDERIDPAVRSSLLRLRDAGERKGRR